MTTIPISARALDGLRECRVSPDESVDDTIRRLIHCYRSSGRAQSAEVDRDVRQALARLGGRATARQVAEAAGYAPATTVKALGRIGARRSGTITLPTGHRSPAYAVREAP